jgi:hypothetical protein
VALRRPVQIVSGIVLLAWAGLSFWGSMAILLMEPIRNWLLTKTIGALLLFGSAWGIVKAIAMVRGPSSPRSTLLSTNLIRGFAIAFAALPVLALLLGTTSLWTGILGCLSYSWIAYTVFRSTGAPANDAQWEFDNADSEDVEE